MADFKVGDYVVYTDGHKYEIGRIKYVCDDGDAFVAYHEGETGAMTPRDMIHKLDNQRVITSLGGEFFNLTEDELKCIRIHMNAMKESLCNQGRWKWAEEYQEIVEKLSRMIGDREYDG